MEKINYIDKSILVFVVLAALNGCNWDPEALAGKSSRFVEHTESADSCSQSGYEMRQSWATMPEGATCSAPMPQIIHIETLSDGGLLVRVKKLPDGKVPSIGKMVFATQWGPERMVAFQCTNTGEALDMSGFEITCQPQSAKRVSPVELASSDLQLLLKAILISNPDCGAQILYEAVSASRPCTYGNTLHSMVAMGSVFFPSLWLEDSDSL
ncbi:MAG: hypothetical protein A2X94_01585 [Bdellovibrionales bacterium GWB1_55_8]|nr:MAG: hypothetical protein A2X94_01585 [Bdellovibrionales bacterium GWB1_55_8]